MVIIKCSQGVVPGATQNITVAQKRQVLDLEVLDQVLDPFGYLDADGSLGEEPLQHRASRSPPTRSPPPLSLASAKRDSDVVLLGPDGLVDFPTSPLETEASVITPSRTVLNAKSPAPPPPAAAWHTPPQKEVNKTANVNFLYICKNEAEF